MASQTLNGGVSISPVAGKSIHRLSIYSQLQVSFTLLDIHDPFIWGTFPNIPIF